MDRFLRRYAVAETDDRASVANSVKASAGRSRQCPIGIGDYLDKLIPFSNNCFSLLGADPATTGGPAYAAQW
jgi:hypothetical protein